LNACFVVGPLHSQSRVITRTTKHHEMYYTLENKNANEEVCGKDSLNEQTDQPPSVADPTVNFLVYAEPNRTSGPLLRAGLKAQPGRSPNPERRAWTTKATVAAARRADPTMPHATPAARRTALGPSRCCGRGGASFQAGSETFCASGSATSGRPRKNVTIAGEAGPGSFWCSRPCSAGRTSWASDPTTQTASRKRAKSCRLGAISSLPTRPPLPQRMITSSPQK
ncbi:unnamed protein product, partial [Musa acuminata subsp. burmannicoides]